jgi:hypothetical protein
VSHTGLDYDLDESIDHVEPKNHMGHPVCTICNFGDNKVLELSFYKGKLLPIQGSMIETYEWCIS